MNKVSPNIVAQYFSFIDVKGKSKNSLVSNIIEKDLLQQYNKSSQNAKRRIKCFLERYQYKTKGHVTKVLMNINNKAVEIYHGKVEYLYIVAVSQYLFILDFMPVYKSPFVSIDIQHINIALFGRQDFSVSLRNSQVI